MAAEQKIERLKYPLHEEDDYKASVQFTLFSEKKVNTADDIVGLGVNKVQDLLKQQKQASADGNFELVAELANQANQTRQETEQIAAQLKEHEGEGRSSAVKATTKVNKTSVSLYLPPGLAYRDNVQYENFDLGPTGASIAAGVGVAASAVEGTKSFLENFKASFGSNPTDMAKLAAIRAAGALSPGSSGTIESGLKLAGGVTVNPNTRTLFKGVNIREFTFAFKMIARSPEEALQIKKIIRFFRSEIYPESIDAVIGGKNVSLGYIFPNKFDIKIKYAGKNNAPEIKPCYLRDVSTTYNASSMAMHSDGEFLEVDLSLAFQETAALVKKDILDDPYYGDVR